MKELFQCSDIREDFQRWLGCGVGPLTISQRGKAAVILNSLPKTEKIDYLYSTATEGGGVTWNNDLKFFGVYDHRDGSLYMTLDSLRTSAVKDMVAPMESDAMTMEEIISAAVNQRVEDTIANDRRNLPVTEITNALVLRDLEYYRSNGAKEKAVKMFFSDIEPDGQFHGGFTLDWPQETAFIAYITDPELFIQTEAEQYIKVHREDLLVGFLKNDALLAEYQALMQDTDNPIRRMKAITDAVKGCGAKTVTVTIQKGGAELTFKMKASYLVGHRNYYNTSGIPAQDRRKFEEMFGRHADHTAADVIKITCGRNTIYEAPAAPVQEMGPVMQMGGM